MKLINKSLNSKYLSLSFFLVILLIIFELFIITPLVGNVLFYTGKANVVIDGAEYGINEDFSVYDSKGSYAGVIGKYFNYPKLYVSHLSDEYFKNLLEVEAISSLNAEKCQLISWNHVPAWRSTDTGLTFKWLDIENENILDIYHKYGCDIAILK